MAGSLVELTVNDAEVRELFSRLASRCANPRPALAEIGEIIVESVQRNFEQHRAPVGAAWKPLSATYAKWKEKKGRNVSDILILRRALMGSINRQADDDKVRVGTNRVYARIHQFGGQISVGARSSTVYFRRDKRTGEVGTKFVKKGKSNFAQAVEIGAHVINMPARPYLGVRDSDWPRIAAAVQKYIVAR
ncbi:MAG: phage virion morphogenesis protein [Desulfobacteraceae bacterium]|nr:phage virion morphogenesis protein [Desulfobacteraceae bacterium]